MPIDFGGTNNARGADSIEPLVNGETLDDTVLNRPLHNLRVRTEELKDAVDALPPPGTTGGYIVRLGTPAARLTYDGDWDGVESPLPVAGNSNSGRLVLSTSTLLIRPIGAPTTTRFATAVFTAVGPSRDFTITSKKYMYQGAGSILFEVVDDLTAGGVTVELLGDDVISDTVSTLTPQSPGHIRVHINGGTHTLTQVQTAIVNDVTANAIIDMDIGTGGDAFAVDAILLTPGRDAVLYSIAAVDLASFFTVGDAGLTDGDVLAIGFQDEFDRLSRVVDETREDVSARLLLWASVLATETHESHVPLFHATSDSGVLLNGDFIVAGVPVQPGGGGSVTDHIADIANPHETTATQIDLEGGIDQIVARINTGTGIIAGVRTALATTVTRGTGRLYSADGNPQLLGFHDIGDIDGVCGLDSNALVPTANLYAQAYSDILARRVDTSPTGFVNLTVGVQLIEIFAEPTAWVGVMPTNGTYAAYTYTLYVNNSLVDTTPVDIEFGFAIIGGSSTIVNTSINVEPSDNVIVITVSTDDDPLLLSNAPSTISLSLDGSAAGGGENLYVQYAELVGSRVIP